MGTFFAFTMQVQIAGILRGELVGSPMPKKIFSTALVVMAIMALTFKFQQAHSTPPTIADSDASACAAIAQLASNDQLDSITVPMEDQQSPDDLVFSSNAINMEGIVPRDTGVFVDLAGDGRLIRVLLGNDGANWSLLPAAFLGSN